MNWWVHVVTEWGSVIQQGFMVEATARRYAADMLDLPSVSAVVTGKGGQPEMRGRGARFDAHVRPAAKGGGK